MMPSASRSQPGPTYQTCMLSIKQARERGKVVKTFDSSKENSPKNFIAWKTLEDSSQRGHNSGHAVNKLNPFCLKSLTV